MGISKKRLTAIVNATKCPTDTESSDSDVEKIEEHISLEEISSDSEDALNSKAKKRKKRGAASKAAVPSNPNDKNEEKNDKGTFEPRVTLR